MPGLVDNAPLSRSSPAARIFGRLDRPVFYGDTPAPAGRFPDALRESGKRLVRPADTGAIASKTESCKAALELP